MTIFIFDAQGIRGPADLHPMMAGTLDLDESGFPLVTVILSGQIKASVLAPYFERVDAWFRSQLRYACVLDISRCQAPTAADRKGITDVMSANEAKVERYCLGAAMVATSPLLRGALTAILWVQPMRHPHAVVATRQEARALCAGWLAEMALPTGRPPSRWGTKGSERP
jgi:hypothetical protein